MIRGRVRGVTTVAVKIDCRKCDFERTLREENIRKFGSVVTGVPTITTFASELELDHLIHEHPDDPTAEVDIINGDWDEWNQEFRPTETDDAPEESVDE